MAYMPSSAPLPQNSLMPPPQGQVNASNARLMRDFMASRTGRERVYSTIPTAASFFKEVSPALAVDAAQMLGQSESARQSVLIGLGLPSNLQDPSLDQIVAAAPANVSLNAPSTTGGLDQTQSGSMPAAAPVQVIPGLWSSQVIPGLWSSPNQNGNGKGQRGVTGIGSRLQIGGRPSKSENQSQFDSGPGCAPPLALPPQPLPAMPSPPARAGSAVSRVHDYSAAPHVRKYLLGTTGQRGAPEPDRPFGGSPMLPTRVLCRV